DGAVARVLVFLGKTEVVDRIREADAVGAEEDAEEAVELSRDLRDERRHVGGAERDARRLDDLTTILLDLLKVRVAGRLPPSVVEICYVPLLAHLIDQVRRDGDRLRRSVVEGPKDV